MWRKIQHSQAINHKKQPTKLIIQLCEATLINSINKILND